MGTPAAAEAATVPAATTAGRPDRQACPVSAVSPPRCPLRTCDHATSTGCGPSACTNSGPGRCSAWSSAADSSRSASLRLSCNRAARAATSAVKASSRSCTTAREASGKSISRAAAPSPSAYQSIVPCASLATGSANNAACAPDNSRSSNACNAPQAATPVCPEPASGCRSSDRVVAMRSVLIAARYGATGGTAGGAAGAAAAGGAPGTQGVVTSATGTPFCLRKSTTASDFCA